MTSTIEEKRVRLQDQDPLTIIPHGDRLLVEVVAVDETTPSGLTIVREDDKGKEYELGWCAGVVINVGSGHRLDESDQALVMQCEPSSDVQLGGMVKAFDDDTGDTLMMVPSTVPMPFERGQVVMCAKFSGSDIKLQGKSYKIITQAHVIATFGAIKMQVGKTLTPFGGTDIQAAIAEAQRLEDANWAEGEATEDADG